MFRYSLLVAMVMAHIPVPQEREHYNILTLDGGAIKGLITA